MGFIELIEKNFNNTRLKKARLKANLTLADVHEKTGISETTLFRYENGITKKVPIESVKKLATLYQINYIWLYGWTSFSLFSSIAGITLSTLYGISFKRLFSESNPNDIFSSTNVQVLYKYFDKINTTNPNQSLYEQLTNDEKIEYNTLKNMIYLVLKTKEDFSEEEIETDEAFILAYYFAHKIKRESNKINNN